MKPTLLLFAILCIQQSPLSAQGVIRPAPGQTVVIEEVKTRTLDPVVVRRQLSIAPRVVVVETPAPVLGTVPVPSAAAIEKYNRVYNVQRNVVVITEKEQSRELSYVTVPVLFVKDTAELLDTQSRADLENVAKIILEISKTQPEARFEIEGHTSTDGTDELNLTLSAARAQRVYDELTQRYGVPASMLTGHGYGEKYPTHPNGTEAQMQEDRRVLVVRSN